MRKLYLLTIWQNGETEKFEYLFNNKQIAKDFLKKVKEKYEDGEYLKYNLKKITINENFTDALVKKTIKKLNAQFK